MTRPDATLLRTPRVNCWRIHFSGTLRETKDRVGSLACGSARADVHRRSPRGVAASSPPSAHDRGGADSIVSGDAAAACRTERRRRYAVPAHGARLFPGASNDLELCQSHDRTVQRHRAARGGIAVKIAMSHLLGVAGAVFVGTSQRSEMDPRGTSRGYQRTLVEFTPLTMASTGAPPAGCRGWSSRRASRFVGKTETVPVRE